LLTVAEECMIARIAPLTGALATAMCGLLLVSAAPAAAEGDIATKLTLDTAYTGAVGRTIEEQPTTIRNCAAIPGGVKADTDGWSFNQPVVGAPVDAYVIGFITLVGETPTPVLIGITAGGLVQVPFSAEALQGQIKPSDLQPVPEGVTGGLLNAGAGGAWLGTPQGWRLAFGVLQIRWAPGGPTTFDLTAVCLPAVVSSPSPAPSPTPSGAGGGAATPTPTTPASNLPITGDRSAALAAAGFALLVVGVLLVVVRRRRNKVRFVL
jgi:LPXTG-motif cell wall-anchored protein